MRAFIEVIIEWKMLQIIVNDADEHVICISEPQSWLILCYDPESNAVYHSNTMNSDISIPLAVQRFPTNIHHPFTENVRVMVEH